MVLAVIAAADQRFGWRDGVGIAGLGSFRRALKCSFDHVL